ncbi:ankyrin repeat domain-containing protein [Endozoicomonas sp. ONNA2]|uniref:ankyrin repeat domain-containing protein n=1 Tax=Endozoicomonas sp. ONNA2 TaxID=2828741 RepID=UPI002148358E|nr:ankyrin repeat domain-containing protein [Endozoicomonas sp. ONNA2]
MNFLRPVPASMGCQSLPDKEVCGASGGSTTSSSSVSPAPITHRPHSSCIEPSPGLTCQTPVGNRAVEIKTEPLCQHEPVTKAHGRTGKITKAQRKQATEDLHNALKCKDLEDLSNDNILALIEKGASVNAKTKHWGQEAALHMAALRGNKRIIELLVNQGADVNAETYFTGQTVMQCAHIHGPITPLIRLMVNAGLKIDTPCDDDKGKMLVHAVRENNCELVEFLLDKGAKVDDEIDKEGTALHLAVRLGQPEIIDMLIQHGANINARSFHMGMKALHLAARLDQPDSIIAMLMKRGADINARDNNAETVLHHTAHLDRPAIIDQLMNHGADINARNNEGRTVLHLVAESGQREILDKLLELDADVNARDNKGRTPLYLLTCTNGQLDTIKYFMSALIGKGANINHRDTDGKTPLAFLVESLRDESAIKHVIETLTKLKADINASDSGRFTALHFAALDGKLDVFDHLLEKGADKHARTKRGKTVLEIARSNGQNTAKMLESLYKDELDVDVINAPCDSEGGTAIAYAARNRQWNLFDLLISRGARIDAWQNAARQLTPLHCAALNDQKDIVSELLKRGANAKLPDTDGRSAIHHAVTDIDKPATQEMPAHRHSLLVDLIENGKVEINAQDKEGRTALHIAANQGRIEIVRELLKRGADFNIQDNEGMTAYDHCSDRSGLFFKMLKIREKEREQVCLLMIENNANVRGKAGISGFVQKMKNLTAEIKP